MAPVLCVLACHLCHLEENLAYGFCGKTGQLSIFEVATLSHGPAPGLGLKAYEASTLLKQDRVWSVPGWVISCVWCLGFSDGINVEYKYKGINE